MEHVMRLPCLHYVTLLVLKNDQKFRRVHVLYVPQLEHFFLFPLFMFDLTSIKCT